MREAFFRTLLSLADADARITLVVGDLGFGVVEPFAKRFPDRYVNAGVAEQNMTGIAVGLALSGRIVFTYSIANFPTIRCLEQIRNDVCYHDANVKIVSVGGGFAYGSLGMTHHATEDLAIMRSLPRIVVVAPGDPREVEAATRLLVATPGPAYLRLGRAGEPIVHGSAPAFALGRALEVRPGGHVTLMSTGGMLAVAVAVADRMAGQGIGVRVLSMHTLKPLDVSAIERAAAETRAIVTLEEHSVIGGLGGAVAEALAESSVKPVAFKRLGVSSEFAPCAGSQDYLRGWYGLSVEGVTEAVRTLLRSARSRA